MQTRTDTTVEKFYEVQYYDEFWKNWQKLCVRSSKKSAMKAVREQLLQPHDTAIGYVKTNKKKYSKENVRVVCYTRVTSTVLTFDEVKF